MANCNCRSLDHWWFADPRGGGVGGKGSTYGYLPCLLSRSAKVHASRRLGVGGPNSPQQSSPRASLLLAGWPRLMDLQSSLSNQVPVTRGERKGGARRTLWKERLETKIKRGNREKGEVEEKEEKQNNTECQQSPHGRHISIHVAREYALHPVPIHPSSSSTRLQLFFSTTHSLFLFLNIIQDLGLALFLMHSPPCVFCSRIICVWRLFSEALLLGFLSPDSIHNALPPKQFQSPPATLTHLV